MDEWMKEAKAHESADKIGMYLTHNGIVRKSAKAKVRLGEENTKNVTGMLFSYDQAKVDAAIKETYEMEGIYYVKAWLNHLSNYQFANPTHYYQADPNNCFLAPSMLIIDPTQLKLSLLFQYFAVIPA